METELSLVMESNQQTSTGHVTLVKDGGEEEEEEERESVAVSSSSETLEQLVDQMEIEISGHDGEGEGKEEEEETGTPKIAGVASTLGKTGVTVEEVTGGKVGKGATSVRIDAGRGGGQGMVQERGVSHGLESPEKRFAAGKMRRKKIKRIRHSSTFELEGVEFPTISLARQLSNEDILNLQSLLQVRRFTRRLGQGGGCVGVSCGCGNVDVVL